MGREGQDMERDPMDGGQEGGTQGGGQEGGTQGGGTQEGGQGERQREGQEGGTQVVPPPSRQAERRDRP